MEWYESEVRELEQRLPTGELSYDTVTFYGSSSIRLWETLPADFPETPLLNLGFGGSTLAACAHFFNRLIVPCRPKKLVLYAGDNDLGDGRSPDDVLHSFEQLQERRASGLPESSLLVMAIKPSPSRWNLRDRICRANDLMQSAAEKTPNTYFIDTYSPLLNDDGTPRREYFQADGLHLSPAGYRAWTKLLNVEFQRYGFKPNGGMAGI